MIFVRYADGSVLGFESKSDVDRFLEDVKVRFAQFRLTLNEDKTRVLRFGRFVAQARAKQGLAKSPTFDFLGFTHICETSRSNGWFQLKRLTSAKRMRARLKAIREALMRRMHELIPVVGRWLRRVVQGYFNYHPVPGKLTAWMRSARTFLGRGYMRYDGEGSVDECPGPGSGAWSSATSRGLGCSTHTRINALRHDSRREPYAVVPHVRICAGGGE